MRTLFKIFSPILAFSLLFGAFFTLLFKPIQANAGFFTSVVGDNAFAQTDKTESTDNSQTMNLLQANVSSASILQEKSDKKDKKQDNTVDSSASVSIVSNNALLSTTRPMSTFIGGIGSGDEAFEDISVYVVRKGDTIAQIAEMFDVTTDTILSVNDMKKGDKLKEGDVLLILPFSGVEYTIVKNDTLQSIAKRHKVSVNDILYANEMELNTKLAIGEKIMIPGASLVEITTNSTFIAKNNPPQNSLPNPTGYFVNPVPSARKSRGTTSYHKGVDLAAVTGTPILASASGRVTFARTGYNGGFGNLVIISHDNGTETLYAHQSKIKTTVGAQVTQGEIIGYVGNTGRSRGAHLHFEVHGAKNPGNDWSWKN